MSEAIVQESVNTTVPAHTTPVEPSKDTNGFSVPEAYKDRGYLKDVNSIEDVYKKLDGAQQLIGQKVTFPTEDSTDEQRMSFNRSAGMPEKAEGYTFETINDVERNPEVDDKIKQIFHEAGISGKAATKIQKGYENFLNESFVKQQELNDEQFDNLSTEILGDRSEEVLASSKQLIEENLPPKLVESFKNLPNEALVTMAAVLDSVKQKYINEDNINDKINTPGHQPDLDPLEFDRSATY